MVYTGMYKEMGSSIPLFIFVMSLLCIVSGSDPAYGDDYCAKLAKVEMTIIHYWKQKQDVVFKSFMTYAIQFNESDYDLTENCSFVMMQKFPNGMVPDKLQWHRDHLLSAFNKEPNAVYVFFNKILPKKRNYFTWMRITCGKFGIKCDSNMPHVWVPEIYMGNCPDWRTQRCKMFHFMLNCEMKVRKECNWYWYKIPVHRPDKIKFKHIRMRPVKIQKKNKVPTDKDREPFQYSLILTKFLPVKVFMLVMIIIWAIAYLADKKRR